MNPNQPKARMKQPVRTSTISWPMIAFGLPLRLYLPMPRPDDDGQRQRCKSADRVHHAGSGEIAIALAEAEVGAQRGEPTAAPGPVGEERIDERAQHERRDQERRVLPALGGRTGDDRQGRIHEDHLEQEDHHDRHVIGAALREEEPVLSEEAEGLAEQGDGVLGVQGRRSAQVADAADAAHLDAEADQPVGQHAHAVHHEVHHHGVVGVLGAAEARLHDGKAGLHEHDQEARNQGPDEVDRDLVLADLVHQVADASGPSSHRTQRRRRPCRSVRHRDRP